MKAKPGIEHYIDWWLNKYHDTNIKEVADKRGWEGQKDSRKFYEAYQVTEAQHDEWHEWFIKEIMKVYKLSRKRAEKESAFAYLDAAPMIKL